MEHPELWIIDTLTVLLPIAGALIACLSLMVHSAALREERRMRKRFAELVKRTYPEQTPDLVAQQRNAKRLKEKFLIYSGLLEAGRSYEDVQIDLEMSDTPLRGYQLSNQYILLVAALISLALWPVREVLRVQAGIIH